MPAAQAGAPLLIATDQESWPGHPAGQRFHRLPQRQERLGIADTAAAAAATEVAAASGAEMRVVGINVDFAPDADALPQSGDSGPTADLRRRSRLVGDPGRRRCPRVPERRGGRDVKHS
ncbi:MAG: hypothetical protein U0R72_13855 [Nakamurella multipartita]